MNKTPDFSAVKAHPLFAAFERGLEAFDLPRAPLAVAVSGGADSLALTLLLLAHCANKGQTLTAFHVDHRLRPTSTEEAHNLKKQLKPWGIDLNILTWNHGPIETGVQEKARSARYALLFEACQTLGIQHLFLGHHLEDQIETVLMRLFRGSGLTGLQGMASVYQEGDISLLRPLLSQTKSDLVQFLKDINQPFFEDPSNENEDFSRVRWRKALAPVLKDTEKHFFLRSLEKIQESAQAVHHYTEQALNTYVTYTETGTGLLDKKFLSRDTPDLIKKNVLETLLKTVSGCSAPIRTASLTHLLTTLSMPDPTPLTLAGCQILPQKQGILFIRERTAISDQEPVTTFLKRPWDGRFWINNLTEGIEANLTIHSLTPEDIHWLKEKQVDTSLISNKVLLTLPVLKKGSEIFSVPHLGYNTHLIHVSFAGMTTEKKDTHEKES